MGGGDDFFSSILPPSLSGNEDFLMWGNPFVKTVALVEGDEYATNPTGMFPLLSNDSGSQASITSATPTTAKTTTTTTASIEDQAQKAADAEADRIKKRKGSKSTVLTSMGGDLSPATTLKQTLGGA
ncbi:MAG: hypothetical protein WC373_06675 [Smithella sp.]|jgi:hypothetical protein